jgi:hypothetical protein
VASVAVISKLTKKEKKQTGRIADREVNKLAPGLSVKSAGSAATATNADQLGGKPAGDYLLAHSRGVALAGAEIGGTGSVDSWFNTLGGAPTASKTGTSQYDITFPGLGDPTHMILQGTLASGAGEILVDSATPTPGQKTVEALTFNSAGAAASARFFVVVYGASSSG